MLNARSDWQLLEIHSRSKAVYAAVRSTVSLTPSGLCTTAVLFVSVWLHLILARFAFCVHVCMNVYVSADVEMAGIGFGRVWARGCYLAEVPSRFDF